MPRHDRIAATLHWAMAAALLAQMAFGFALDTIAPRGTPDRAPVINLHKSVGLLLMLLVVVRLAWRLTHRPLPWPAGTPAWQQRAAAWGHAALYACMAALPASGYIASNFSRHGVRLFGLRLPPWGPDLPGVYGFFDGLHLAVAIGLLLLVAGHVAMALWHRLRASHEVLAVPMNWRTP